MSASSPTGGLLLRALRSSAPGVTRALAGTLLDPQRRRAVAAALARLQESQRGVPLLVGSPVQRHAMAPAAVRIERTRTRRRRSHAEQVAVTVWFGEGPALPAPGGRLGRGAVRLGAGVASAAAVAAATTLVARMSERPAPRALPGASPVPRLPAANP